MLKSYFTVLFLFRALTVLVPFVAAVYLFSLAPWVGGTPALVLAQLCLLAFFLCRHVGFSVTDSLKNGLACIRPINAQALFVGVLYAKLAQHNMLNSAAEQELEDWVRQHKFLNYFTNLVFPSTNIVPFFILTLVMANLLTLDRSLPPLEIAISFVPVLMGAAILLLTFVVTARCGLVVYSAVSGRECTEGTSWVFWAFTGMFTAPIVIPYLALLTVRHLGELDARYCPETPTKSTFVLTTLSLVSVAIVYGVSYLMSGGGQHTAAPVAATSSPAITAKQGEPGGTASKVRVLTEADFSKMFEQIGVAIANKDSGFAEQIGGTGGRVPGANVAALRDLMVLHHEKGGITKVLSTPAVDVAPNDNSASSPFSSTPAFSHSKYPVRRVTYFVETNPAVVQGSGNQPFKFGRYVSLTAAVDEKSLNVVWALATSSRGGTGRVSDRGAYEVGYSPNFPGYPDIAFK
jgi:hypothetical protein